MDDWRLLLPEPVRRFPADLAAVVALTVLTVLVATVPGVRETPLRVVVGLPFVLFLPGYALVSALFPERGPEPAVRDGIEERSEFVDEDGGIDGVERMALSFGLSIAIVPLLGLVLNYTPWGIRLVPVLVSVGLFTVGCAVFAAHRRRGHPADERFTVPYRDWAGRGLRELFEHDSRADLVLNVVLVLAVLLALSSVVYAVAVPQEGERFTELYLLTEDDDGELVASGYPEEFVQGQSESLYVGVENNEHETVEYAIVVQLQRVEGEGETAEITEREQLDTVETTLEHGESWHHEHEVGPTMVGEELRLTYLLYVNGVPDEPTRENAYRDVHLWIDVEEGDEDA